MMRTTTMLRPSLTRSMAWMGLCVLVTLPVRTKAAEDGLVEIHRGVATFDVGTNISAITVHGKSTAVVGRARTSHGADSFEFHELEAIVPVMTLSTGIQVRDEHMLKRVFATPDGALPDVRFIANTVSCPKVVRTATCEASGELTIRNIRRPFAIDLKMTGEGDQVHAFGDGIVRLS